MESIKIVFTDDVRAEVQLFSDEVLIGKMSMAMTAGKLTVFHTEVDPKFEGRGFAKLLLGELVHYARERELKIIPLCLYVSAQFHRNPAKYEDVWSKEHS